MAFVNAITTPERLIRLEAVHNFRDLGGYATADGRELRWGSLFRADGLQRLSPADVEAIKSLGLHTVLDLRTDRELAERGTFPVDAYPVTFHHLPVIDVTWDLAPSIPEDDAVRFLFEQYQSILAFGEPLFAKAFHVLALPGALPAVFHCAAGKDRTGILAALVLGALGVPHDVVAEDYGLSRDAVERTRRWAETNNPEAAAAWAKVPASHMAAEPEAMAALLALLTERHGSVRRYVTSIGVPNALLLHLESELLVDAA
jgi:protein-tyrosine phosphatase